MFMKLYLSSYRVPVPEDLERLVGKPLNRTRLALIPNAKDYYAKRAWKFKVDAYVNYFESLGLIADAVDLRNLNHSDEVKSILKAHDIIWAIGGNTFCLRYEMQRSGFDNAINDLLRSGIVYGGDSAGAIVAGLKISGFGIEIVDAPEFTEKIVEEGLGLIPYIVIPHADNPAFSSITKTIKSKLVGRKVIELNDSQAIIFSDKEHHHIVEAPQPSS